MKQILEMLKKNETSIRQISKITGCTYGNLLKGSKKPIKGLPYDPSAINEEEIERIVKAKLGDTFETFDWTDLIAVATEPRVKTEWIDFETGETMKFKRGHGKADPETIYTVIFETDTHVVLNPNIGTEPRVIAKTTLRLFGAYNVYAEPVEEVGSALSSEVDTEVDYEALEQQVEEENIAAEKIIKKSARRSSKK